MPQRTFTAGATTWIVAPSGLVTANNQDEFGLIFTPKSGPATDARYTRYSPGATRSREQSFRELSDDTLRDLLTQSQPAATAPESGYGARLAR